MSRYPLGRWSIGEGSMGASVHTRRLAEGEGGGYYLYDWGYGDSHIILTELVKGTTQAQRRDGKRSFYVEIDRITVDPELVRDKPIKANQEEVARLIFADMRKRFARIAEWIPYGNDGKTIWFHEKITRERRKVSE